MDEDDEAQLAVASRMAEAMAGDDGDGEVGRGGGSVVVLRGSMQRERTEEGREERAAAEGGRGARVAGLDTGRFCSSGGWLRAVPSCGQRHGSRWMRCRTVEMTRGEWAGGLGWMGLSWEAGPKGRKKGSGPERMGCGQICCFPEKKQREREEEKRERWKKEKEGK